jgi:hypothetical protein
MLLRVEMDGFVLEKTGVDVMVSASLRLVSRCHNPSLITFDRSTIDMTHSLSALDSITVHAVLTVRLWVRFPPVQWQRLHAFFGVFLSLIR